MLSLHSQRIFIFGEGIDMRKGVEGLSALVERAFPDELLTGSFFVFLNQGRDKIKVLYWDHDGFALWYKRLEKGRYSRLTSDNIAITRRDMLMLLEGVTPLKISHRLSL